MSRRRRAVATVAVGVLLAACGSSSGTSSPPAAAPAGSLSGTVTVFAAASLKEAFTRLGTQFEAAHPGVRVAFNFGPSSGLATQITQGAPADVFASASGKSMDQVVKAGAAAAPKDFAANAMQIAVPPANPGGVTGLPDLARKDVTVALCQAAVPCGATAAKVFAKGGITVRPVTEEVDVKAVLAKVTLGEVDAGVVYVTDVRAAGAKVKGIAIPADQNASTTYPIAALSRSTNSVAAQAFTDQVLSAQGSAALTAAGFARP